MLLTISADEAQEKMKALPADGFTLLDVRTQEEYAPAHIEGAVLLPYDAIADHASEILPDPEQPVFVYCRTGRRSRIAAEALSAMGYREVYDFGGIVDWHYGTVATVTP